MFCDEIVAKLNKLYAYDDADLILIESFPLTVTYRELKRTYQTAIELRWGFSLAEIVPLVPS